jgi:hypothetical protein
VEATEQEKKGERRKKPKPEEQEGMPQHQRCPPELLLSNTVFQIQLWVVVVTAIFFLSSSVGML